MWQGAVRGPLRQTEAWGARYPAGRARVPHHVAVPHVIAASPPSWAPRWTKSHAYRRSDAYQARYDLSRWNLKSRDPCLGGCGVGLESLRICLSWSHDDDYAELMPPEEHFQMPPASSGWSFACHELSDGERRVVQLEGHRVLLLRHKGETYALEERCAHQGASLATGDLEDLADGPKLRCPVHGLCFDLRTGRAGDLAQRIYAVRSRDGDVEVAVRGRKRPIEAEPLGLGARPSIFVS